MLLEIKNINKFYGDNHVLKDVSFTASSSRTLGLLGRNGHGKTTCMKIIMGIIYGDSGEVLLNGAPLKNSGVKLGYLPEERGLYQKVQILEQMVYFGKLRGMSAAAARASAAGLLEKLGMTEYTKKKADSLSKGNQQKIQLGIALLNDPDIIILDEPFSGLDPVNSKILQNLILESVEKSKLIIFSSHQMAQVEEFCQDVCLIKHGEVKLTGNLREIKNSYPKDKILVITEAGEELKMDAPQDGDLSQIIAEFRQKGVGIESISVLKPSLLEIFLEKVGEGDEGA
ncbi:MAG: ATP-binding cassette domain-containing protein [Clostridiales bacterium]|jgi:ABC-2 type transport system ATP-binding protein|nr:ATP-binding cassette domain-containing protein [Clostridiales bacterium]